MKGAVAPLLINHASQDPVLQNHPGLTKYGIESYIAVPLTRRDGTYIGTLCALDPLPSRLSEDDFTIFELLAQLIAFELEAEEERTAREKQIGALNDIISIANHDLRQPLTTLQVRTQLLLRQAEREETSPAIIDRVKGVVSDVKRMVSLTESLLDIGRIRAGTFQIDKAIINFTALVAQAVEDARLTSPSYSFKLELPSQPILLAADEVKIGQVISNLLNNAVKYSPDASKPIEIKLYTTTTSATGELAILQVRDYGIGVEKSDLAKLFQRQYRAERAVESGVDGSGFGLYISRKIIETHNGRIWAELPEDSGLMVVFALPVLTD